MREILIEFEDFRRLDEAYEKDGHIVEYAWSGRRPFKNALYFSEIPRGPVLHKKKNQSRFKYNGETFFTLEID